MFNVIGHIKNFLAHLSKFEYLKKRNKYKIQDIIYQQGNLFKNKTRIHIGRRRYESSIAETMIKSFYYYPCSSAFICGKENRQNHHFDRYARRVRGLSPPKTVGLRGLSPPEPGGHKALPYNSWNHDQGRSFDYDIQNLKKISRKHTRMNADRRILVRVRLR
jgi:hypothetical protein